MLKFKYTTSLKNWEILIQRLTFAGFPKYVGGHETVRHRHFPP